MSDRPVPNNFSGAWEAYADELEGQVLAERLEHTKTKCALDGAKGRIAELEGQVADYKCQLAIERGIGQATKEQDKYMKLDKEYEATLKLGKTSTTGDPEGTITVVKSSKLKAEG